MDVFKHFVLTIGKYSIINNIIFQADDSELADNKSDANFDQAVQDMMDLDADEGSDYDEDDKEGDRLAFFQEFCLHKQNYYQDKMEYKKITP